MSGRYKFSSRQALHVRKLSLFLSSSKEAFSQRVLKPPSSTLEVYKEGSSVGSSQNVS
jgi:hypothetical protein